MPTATLSLPPTPEHVRTARLVVVAAARRAGVAEDVVDDVRLAVGEAVARAVLRHAASGTDADVEVVVDDDEGMALALVRAVAPEVEIEPRMPTGTTLRLRWPLTDD